eukprot:GFUD01052027.1.p1 GENE.GFUD01052027.1~~GFUD01052027.1.p1  ORF type:complete len:199 (+),score=70.60 GFUD01052027.1:103-699(+)
MVQNHLPDIRNNSPEQLCSPSSHLSVASRSSSRASTSIACSTRECSPEYMLESVSISSHDPLSPLSPLPPQYPQQAQSPPSKTPIPSDSPLFSQPVVDESRKQLKSFTKSLRRARSFKAAREKIEKKEEGSEADLRGQEVTFLIKKSLSGRIGWKIMPEDEKMNLKINKECVGQVMEKIRDLQFCGENVPDKMSIMIE